MRWADLDMNGHVRSTAYSDLAATARVEFFAEQGLTPARMVRLGVGPVLFEEHQVFHRETKFGEELEVTLRIADPVPGGQRATVAHELRDANGGLRATVTVVGGWLSLHERRIVSPPKEIADLLARINRLSGTSHQPAPLQEVDVTIDSAITQDHQTRDLARRYAEAWNAHDVEGLLSCQRHDMVFHLHLEGSGPTSGVEELRALYSFFFRAMPDYHADITRELVADDAIVWEYTITATLAEDFPIGEASGKPNGETVTLDAVDVITCSQDKVLTKHTYVDAIALQRGMEL